VKLSRKTDTENLVGYLFISPWLIGFFAFTLIPIAMSLYYAFTDYNFISEARWIGFDNFERMFTADRRYWNSVRATLTFVFTGVPLRLALALLVAIVLNKKHRGISAYRALFYLPSLIGSSVAIGLVWRRFFGSNGAVESLLSLFGIEFQYSLLGNPATAIWTIILLVIWQFGSSMLIFLAGLKNIPVSFYEAAVVDGANAWSKFIRITLPLLSPVIFFNLIMQTINGFRIFTESYVVTEGGPLDSTLFYSIYLYQRGFRFFDMGYASAMAWILLAVTALFTVLIFRSSNSWVHYESKVG
jgi:multiple sugar transport system permease protein